MPGFMLNNRQIRSLVGMAGIREPVPGSPLQLLSKEERPLIPLEPAFTSLVNEHILEPENGRWRVNKLFALALETCVRPEEVIELSTVIKPYFAFSIARRQAFWSECSRNIEGITKFYFPLSRNMVLLLLTDALTSQAPEPDQCGFHFLGSVEEAFVLSTVMHKIREYPVELAVSDLVNSVAREASMPQFTASFISMAGEKSLDRLAKSSEAISAVIGKLGVNGYLSLSDGKVKPSPAVETALKSPPQSGFVISHSEISETAIQSQSLLVLNAGGRKLVFRLRSSRGETPLFEWVEMSRQQIRLLIAGLLLPTVVLNRVNLDAKNTGSPPTPSPAFCFTCGAKLKSGAAFCGQCGSPIKKRN